MPRKEHFEIEGDIARALRADKAKNGEKSVSQTLRRWAKAIEEDAKRPAW